MLILLGHAWGMGGTIRATINLAGHLVRRYDVEILSVRRGRETPFFPVAPAVKLTVLDAEWPPSVPWIARPLRSVLRRFPSVLMDRRDAAVRHWNLWVDIMVARKLRRQAGFLITTRPGLNLVAADLSPPGLVTIGMEQMNLGVHRPALRRRMQKRYPRLDALVVLTAEDEARYAEFLSGQVRLIRIPNTVYGLDGGNARLDARTILAAGRFTPQKGFDMLIDAFARVSPQHPDWRLRICGGGRLQPALQAQIDDLGLTGVVTLADRARHLSGEMANASIFALSSRAEGFPLVLIEAMSRGMAVVAFDCPTGPRDVIEEHRSGILVPPRDVEALAAALREMIESDDLRRRCGAAAAESARRYTIDAIGPRWDALLEELGSARADFGARGRGPRGLTLHRLGRDRG